MEELITTTKETLAKLSQALTEKEVDLIQREEIVEKRERQIEESTQRCEGLRDIDTVTFNVGGQHFMYTVDQIEAHPDSLFACFISERWNKRNKGEDGIVLKQRVFDIARSARLFRYFDDYLRLGQVNVDKEDMELVKEEGNFYGISLMVPIVTEPQEKWHWIDKDGLNAGRVLSGYTKNLYFKGTLDLSKDVNIWTLKCTGKYSIGIGRGLFDFTASPYPYILVEQSGYLYYAGLPPQQRDVGKFFNHNGTFTFLFDKLNKKLEISSDAQTRYLEYVEGKDWYIFVWIYTKENTGSTIEILE